MEKFKNNMELISIVVPIYNVEEHITKMIISVLNQTYSNFELILIDDGSTDNSKSICDRFSQKDKRIIFYSQSNQGVSAARNLGISKASGKYMLFIDADDWINENLLETYYNLMIKDSNELLISEYNVVSKGKIIPQKDDILEGNISIQKALYKIINPTGYYGSVWGKLFLSDIIIKNDIEFNSTISVGEDLLFMIEYLQYCSKITYAPNCLYNYLIRDNSVLNTINLKRLDILCVYKQLIENNNFNEKLKRRIQSVYVWECVDWGCRLSGKKYNTITRKLRNEALCKMHIFLLNDVFNYKTKINTLVKFFVPGFVYKLKYKNIELIN